MVYRMKIKHCKKTFVILFFLFALSCALNAAEEKKWLKALSAEASLPHIYPFGSFYYSHLFTSNKQMEFNIGVHFTIYEDNFILIPFWTLKYHIAPKEKISPFASAEFFIIYPILGIGTEIKLNSRVIIPATLRFQITMDNFAFTVGITFLF